MSLTKKIFMKSPLIIKSLLINLEAIRRDTTRRWGSYQQIYDGINNDNIFPLNYKEIQEKNLEKLLASVKKSVPLYEQYNDINSLKDLKHLPIVKKENMMEDLNQHITTDINIKKLSKGVTSGSTGKPLTFYKDKETIRYNYIYYDKMFEVLGLNKNDRQSRFSGVTLFDFNKVNPPFWVYIKKYKQLQCSLYHLNENNYMKYLEAMKTYGITYGTGYAQTWLILAEYIIKNNYPAPKLKAIITDSEGVNDSQQDIIEKAFSTTVYQTYGLSEVGQIAFQCKNRVYHIVPELAYIEVLDKDENQVDEDELGEIIVTSLYSAKAPFIRYATGDLARIGKNECSCGWNSQTLNDIEGRINDYVLTKENNKINHLSHLIKPAKGIINSQIIQTEINSIRINIVPSKNFEPSSMDEVIKHGRMYLGDMNIEWRAVNELEKTSNGKIKYVIRKFEP